MPTFLYRKLVRDNIWRWHEESGHTVVGEELSGARLLQAMARKLHEEADEVAGATTRDELIEEIADVWQLLDDICANEGINVKQIRAAKHKKHEIKGGFLEGKFIETVRMPDDADEWVAYCRRDPSKYPEIDERTGKVDPELPDLEKGHYLHVKSGKMYDVVGFAVHTETNDPLVLYKPLYESKYEYFVRPYDMFLEKVESDGKSRRRFEMIDSDH